VNYQDYAARFWTHKAVAEVRSYGTVVEGGEAHELLLAQTPGRRSVVITAGFHGDEKAGSLTLLEFLPRVIEHARRREVGLRVYPCLNPSGFTDATRYNRSKESPNNDFLRYEMGPGEIRDTLPQGSPPSGYKRWVVFRESPKETRALLADLEVAPRPDAALDIHQDPWLEGAWTYAYTFGPRAAYLPLVRQSEAHLPVARTCEVDDDVRSDGDGLIELHDGSVTDYLFRRGVPFAAALETTTAAPMAACHEVNLAWILGFIDLAAEA
jgi:predicted deacylase